MMRDNDTPRGALNLTEAAKYAGVSRPTMIEWVNRHDFPAFRVGRRWVIPVATLDRWLAERANERASV